MPAARGLGWGTYGAVAAAVAVNLAFFLGGGIWERAVKTCIDVFQALSIPIEAWPGFIIFVCVWSPIMYTLGYYMCFLEIGDEDDKVEPSFMGKDYRGKNFQGNTEDPVKMVIVVRDDLKMPAGKVATQVGHATVGIYRRLWKKNAGLTQAWEDSGLLKMITKVPGESEMLHVQKRAKGMGLPTYIVRDAALRVVDITKLENGNRTVLCFLGPVSALPKAMQGLVAYDAADAAEQAESVE